MDLSGRVVLSAAMATVMMLCGAVLQGCGAAGGPPVTPQEGESAAPDSTASELGAAAEPNGRLSGTDWRLVEIQSMDDAVGTVRPEDPSLYTMRLNHDGTVNMSLNCNRANGTWSAEASADPSNGRFEFGPLAATRAICPPPSLDEQIAAQAEYIRSYVLADGWLYLSLMADGGIWAWEPNEGGFETAPDAILEEAVLQALPGYTQEMVEIDGQQARYVYSRADLNGDGSDEVFVYLMGSIFCGTGGCNLLVFTPANDGYVLVNNFPISREPVIVSPEKTEGWHDLMRLESGGGAPATYVRHAFDGEKYVERERTPADTPPAGTSVLTGGFTFEDGIPLEPRR